MRRREIEAAVVPLPIPDITPPETKTYLVCTIYHSKTNPCRQLGKLVKFVSQSGMEKEIQFFHKISHPSTPDLTKLYEALTQEMKFPNPSLENLIESYKYGLAIVMVDGEKAVGFTRFIPRLGERMKNLLDLESNFPQIWETGSSIILNDPNYRGKGLFVPLRTKLLELITDKINRQEILVLSKTKTLAVYKGWRRTSDEIGIDFYPSVHTEFPMIAPFTCICNPNFGCGFHLSTECPERITKQQLDGLEQMTSPTEGGIPCTMYVSNKKLAKELDGTLENKFSLSFKNPQKALVDKLKEIGYYF